MLSLEQVAEEWKFWRAVDEDPETAANPQVRNLMAAVRTSGSAQSTRVEVGSRLSPTIAGNYIGVDLSPHPAGGGSPGR